MAIIITIITVSYKTQNEMCEQNVGFILTYSTYRTIKNKLPVQRKNKYNLCVINKRCVCTNFVSFAANRY